MTGFAHIARSGSPLETRRIAERLGRLCARGDVIALVGDLGAGKTCFVQGLARGLGVPDREVVSPTFNLVQHHDGKRVALEHIDLYRLGSADELAELGLLDGEILGADCVAAVEWMDRFPEAFPAALWVRLAHAGEKERRVDARSGGPRAKVLLRDWRRALRVSSRP